jgi:hypothetical protein
MAKVLHKSGKFSPEEMAYELPAEIDFSKLRYVSSGTETACRLLDRSKRVVGLGPDVARAFPDSEAVNNALRTIWRSFPVATARRAFAGRIQRACRVAKGNARRRRPDSGSRGISSKLI